MAFSLAEGSAIKLDIALWLDRPNTVCKRPQIVYIIDMQLTAQPLCYCQYRTKMIQLIC